MDDRKQLLRDIALVSARRTEVWAEVLSSKDRSDLEERLTRLFQVSALSAKTLAGLPLHAFTDEAIARIHEDLASTDSA